MDNPKEQLVNKLKEANNVLVTVSADPSVDQLAGAIGLTLFLTKLRKHATAVFSGKPPSTIEFLKPEETLEGNTDSLQDFIIALDKNKADKIRYKVEDQMVKIFITPYRASIGQDDLVFSKGEFNVDVVVALGVKKKEELDQAITAHGRILHDATVTTVNTREGAELGSLNWTDAQASSLCEMIVALADQIKPNSFDGQMATALLTGIVAETKRFSNEKTDSQTMNASAKLMAAGANQQLVANKLEESPPPVTPAGKEEGEDEGESKKPAEEITEDGSLVIHHEEKQKKPEEKPEEKIEKPAEKAPEKPEAPAEKQPEAEEPQKEQPKEEKPAAPEEAKKPASEQEATPPSSEAEPKLPAPQSEEPKKKAAEAEEPPRPVPATPSPPPVAKPDRTAPADESRQRKEEKQEEKEHEHGKFLSFIKGGKDHKEDEHKESSAKEQEETPAPEPIPRTTVVEPQPPAPQISISDQGELQSLESEHPDIHIKPEHRHILNAPPTTQRHEDDVAGGTAGQSLQPGRIAGPPSMGGKLNAIADDDDDEASPMNLPPVQGKQQLLSHESAKDQAKAEKPEPESQAESPPNLAPAAKSSPTPTPPPAPTSTAPPPAPAFPTPPPVPPPQPEPPKEPDVPPPAPETDKLQPKLPNSFMKVLDNETLKELEHRTHSPHQTQAAQEFKDKTLNKIESSIHARHTSPTSGMDYEPSKSEPPYSKGTAPTAAPKKPMAKHGSITPPTSKTAPAPHPVTPSPASSSAPPASTPAPSGSTATPRTDSARDAVTQAFQSASPSPAAASPAPQSGPYPHIDDQGTVTFKATPASDAAMPGAGTLHAPPPTPDPTSSQTSTPAPPPPVPPPIPQQFLASDQSAA